MFFGLLCFYLFIPSEQATTHAVMLTTARLEAISAAAAAEATVLLLRREMKPLLQWQPWGKRPRGKSLLRNACT